MVIIVWGTSMLNTVRETTVPFSLPSPSPPLAHIPHHVIGLHAHESDASERSTTGLNPKLQCYLATRNNVAGNSMTKQEEKSKKIHITQTLFIAFYLKKMLMLFFLDNHPS